MDYKIIIILFLIGTIPLFTGVMATDLTIQKDTAADDLLNYTVYTNSYGVDQFWVDNNGFVYANGTLVTGGVGGDLTGSGVDNYIAIWNGTTTINGTDKFIYNFDTNQLELRTNGTTTWDIPTQISPNTGIFGINGQYGIDGYPGAFFQSASWASNAGTKSIVAVFGEGISNPDDAAGTSRAWGGNFVAYSNASTGNAIGTEINYGDLVDGGTAYGLVIASAGNFGTEAHIQMQSANAQSRPTDGIKFNGDTINGGSLIKTSGSVTADKGIDFSGATFSTVAIDLENQGIADAGFIAYGAWPTLTISSGAITVSKTNNQIDTESSASTDDIDTINGGQTSQIIILKAINSAHTVVIKDSTGNIRTSGDCTLDHSDDSFMAIKFALIWIQIACNDNNT